MKSQALPEIPLIGLIAVATIMAGIVIPTTIVKITIDKELAFTHKYEKSQQVLLTLLSSTHESELRKLNVYDVVSQKALFESYPCRTDEGVENGPNPSCAAGYVCIPYGNRPAGICAHYSTLRQGESVARAINTKLANSFNPDIKSPDLQTPGYCISSRNINGQQSSLPITGELTAIEVEAKSTELIKREAGCAVTDSVFDTIIVVPYNKESLVRLLRITV